jgi:hypothetical protein
VLERNVSDGQVDPVVGMSVTGDDAGDVLECDVLLQVREGPRSAVDPHLRIIR